MQTQREVALAPSPVVVVRSAARQGRMEQGPIGGADIDDHRRWARRAAATSAVPISHAVSSEKRGKTSIVSCRSRSSKEGAVVMRTSPMDGSASRVSRATTPRRRQLWPLCSPFGNLRWHPTAVKGRAVQGCCGAVKDQFGSCLRAVGCETVPGADPLHQHGATAMPVAFTMTQIALPTGIAKSAAVRAEMSRGSRASPAIAWRSTVKKHPTCGSPSRMAFQLCPSSRDRQTAAAASGGKRPAVSPFRGSVQIVSGSRGCTRIGKPKVEGSPLVMSSQRRPPSAERQTP